MKKDKKKNLHEGFVRLSPRPTSGREHIIAERGSAKNEDTVTNYPIFLSPETARVDLPSSHAPNSNFSYALLSDLSSYFSLSFIGNFLFFSFFCFNFASRGSNLEAWLFFQRKFPRPFTRACG